MRSLLVENARDRIGRVAFRGDAFVPVVIGRRRILQLDRFEPGIFPRRLVEVAVNANVAFHAKDDLVDGDALSLGGRAAMRNVRSSVRDGS